MNELAYGCVHDLWWVGGWVGGWKVSAQLVIVVAAATASTSMNVIRTRFVNARIRTASSSDV